MSENEKKLQDLLIKTMEADRAIMECADFALKVQMAEIKAQEVKIERLNRFLTEEQARSDELRIELASARRAHREAEHEVEALHQELANMTKVSESWRRDFCTRAEAFSELHAEMNHVIDERLLEEQGRLEEVATSMEADAGFGGDKEYDDYWNDRFGFPCDCPMCSDY